MISLGDDGWTHNLIYPCHLLIAVPVPSQDSERSCVLGVELFLYFNYYMNAGIF